MSSLVLAFDTATEEVALAVGRPAHGETVLDASRDFTAPRAALSRLVPAISDVLHEASASASAVGTVVVGRGPGSFTGVRIAVSTAKGLAQGLGVPLYGVGTLDAIAWGLAGHEGLLGVVGDAMRGEIYPALFRCGAGRVERVSPHSVSDPAILAEEWAALDEPVLLVGNGLAKYREVLTRTGGSRFEIADPARWTPTGLGLLRAFDAARSDGAAGTGDPATLLPVYTRLSDAEENERAAGGPR